MLSLQINILTRLKSMTIKNISPLILASTLLLLSGCKLSDKIEAEFERIKNQYEEYTGNGEDRGPRPFDVVYQNSEDVQMAVVSPSCSNNQIPQYVYFATQADATNNIFNAISNLYSYPAQGTLKPYWDLRYVNPVSRYVYGTTATEYANHAEYTGLDARSGNQNIIVGTAASQIDSSGSVIQSKCVNNVLTAGTTLNLNDAPAQSLVYAGIQSTFNYQIDPNNHIRPWKADGSGNLLAQASFDSPIYHNFASNIGGSISFNIFLYNPKINKHLNYVIGVYAAGGAWQIEKAGIRFDPTTNIIHVATVAKDDSWWCTISPKSKSIIEILDSTRTTSDDGIWNNFYRVNISYQNLLAVLNELRTNPPAAVAGQDFGLNPQDWEVTLASVQYELEEQGGQARFSGSFSGFGVYISQLPF